MSWFDFDDSYAWFVGVVFVLDYSAFFAAFLVVPCPPMVVLVVGVVIVLAECVVVVCSYVG